MLLQLFGFFSFLFVCFASAFVFLVCLFLFVVFIGAFLFLFQLLESRLLSPSDLDFRSFLCIFSSAGCGVSVSPFKSISAAPIGTTASAACSLLNVSWIRVSCCSSKTDPPSTSPRRKPFMSTRRACSCLASVDKDLRGKLGSLHPAALWSFPPPPDASALALAYVC